MATRHRLIKEAGGGKRVTWADVHKASGLKRKVSQRVMMDALRDKGVRYRKPCEKLYISEQDAKIRYKQ